MYKMVFCWIVLQVSSRLFKVTHLSQTMCLVLSTTLDTDIIILQYSTSFLYYTVRILKFMNVLLSMMSEKQWTPFYSDLDFWKCLKLIICLDLCLMLCLSPRDFRYSPLNRFHKTSLHRRRYFTLFLRWASPSSVLSRLGWPYIMAHGVKTGSWTSSSTYDRERLFSATCTSSKTSSSSFHVRCARPILSDNARFTTPNLSNCLPPPLPPTKGFCLD